MRPVTILALFNGTYPGGMAMSNRLHYYAKAIQDSSCSIRVASIYSKPSFGFHEGIPFSSLNAIPFRAGAWRHRWNHFFYNGFKTATFLFRQKNQYEIVWLIGFGFFTTLILSAIAAFHHKEVVLEVNEKPYSVGGSKLSEFSILNDFWRWMTFKLVYPRVSGFVVISEPLEKLVSKYKAPWAKVIRIPILNHPRPKLKLPSKVGSCYILHAGALSEKKDGILTVLKGFSLAIKNLEPGSLKFVLTSRLALASLHSDMKKIIDDGGFADQVIFTDHLTPDELDCYMSNAALAIVHKPNNEQNKYNFPTKLGDYFSYGVPVIATNVGEMCKFLVDGLNCLLVEPGDSHAIAERIVFILKNPSKADEMRFAGKLLVENQFNYVKYRDHLERFFHRIMKKD